MWSYTGLICLMGVLLSSVCSAQPKAKEWFTVPITRNEQGLIIVTLTTQDKKELRLILDTGSPISLITTRCLLRLGKTLPEVTTKGGINGLRFQGETEIKKLSWENAEFEEAPFYVIDHQTVFGDEIDGILGLEYMKQFVYVFNFSKKELTVIHTGGMTSERKSLFGFAKSSSTMLTYDKKNHKYFINTLLEGATVPMVMDTGSMLTIVSSEMASKLYNPEPIDMVTTSTIGAERRVLDVVKAKRLEIAKTVFSQVILHSQSYGTFAYPIMGLDVLEKMDFAINFPEKKMYIKQPAKP